MTAPNVNIFVADLIMAELSSIGIITVCLSPGSRSTPLAIAAANHPNIDVHIVYDERAAAYYAVGYARASGKPMAVICTSGTAVANYFPAVIEAYQSRLPMILLTADRPDELQNRGANQTINQQNIYGDYVIGHVTISAPDEHTEPADILTGLTNALSGLESTEPGPVHINCRFREPLAPVEQDFDENRMQAQIEKYRAANFPVASPVPVIDTSAVASIVEKMQKVSRGLIVAGPIASSAVESEICELGERLNWPVVTDLLSGLRFGDKTVLCKNYDLYLDKESLAESFRPEIVLHIGGLPTSKRLNQFLADCRGMEYVKIQNHNRTIDPDHMETQCIIAPPLAFVRQLINRLPDRPNKDYLQSWQDAEHSCRKRLHDFFATNTLTEASLTFRLGDVLADGDALFLSNSMPVRDADTFMACDGKDILVGANRGVSGIDGVIASACGFARGSGRPTTLLIGDLAFMHDLNSLYLAAQSKPPVIIIAVNNHGGGIFHFLPIAEYDRYFEKYFAAPHAMTFEYAAKQFALPYHCPQTMPDFVNVYKDVRKRNKSAMIEILSDRNDNAAEHRAVKEFVHHAMTEGK